jgi:hypothetical protein
MNNPFTFEAEPFTGGKPARLRNHNLDTLETDPYAGTEELTDEFGPGDGETDLVTEFEQAGNACPGYERGEIELSHCQLGACQKGVLPADVMRHPRGLLIADFGVGWSGIKAATKTEKLLQDWMKETRANLHSYVLRIYGYSDCVGSEKNNTALRLARAERVFGLLDKDIQTRVDFRVAAKAGDYVVDNLTRESRARNRGVIIERATVGGITVNVQGTAPRPPPPPPTPPPPPQPTPPPPPPQTPHPHHAATTLVAGGRQVQLEEQKKAPRQARLLRTLRRTRGRDHRVGQCHRQ